jgi:hypothetical protein
MRFNKPQGFCDGADELVLVGEHPIHVNPSAKQNNNDNQPEKKPEQLNKG